MVAAGAPIGLTATPAVSLASPTLVSHANPYAGCNATGSTDLSENEYVSAGNMNYTNTEVEPYVAADPRTVGTSHTSLIGVWQQDRWSSGGAHGIVAASSFDGGTTWAETPLPFSSCATHRSRFVRASDPWVSIGPDGTAYAGALGASRTSSAVLVATSRDGGKTWGTVRDITARTGSRYEDDKETITADPIRPGVAYVTWNRIWRPTATHHQRTWFAKTTDGGRTWSPPKQIVPSVSGADTFQDQLVLDRRTHALYTIFVQTVDHAKPAPVCPKTHWGRTCKTVHASGGSAPAKFIAFVKSNDGGETWSKPHAIARVQPLNPLEDFQYRLGYPGPTAASDPVSGKLYVVWTDTRFNQSETPEIAISVSTDGGSTWSAPRQVSAKSDRPAFTPAVAINAQGVIGVSYYRANDLYASYTDTDPHPPPVLVDAWFARSTDGGMHFGNPVRLGGPCDYWRAPLANGYFLGDYQGLAVAGLTFHPLFVMTNSGHAGNRTDVFTTAVTP
jgi:hypothetical protein